MSDDDRRRDEPPGDDPQDLDTWLARELDSDGPDAGWMEEDTDPPDDPPGSAGEQPASASREQPDALRGEEAADQDADTLRPGNPGTRNRPAEEPPPGRETVGGGTPRPLQRLVDAWPLGLIIIAGLALLLLLAGGYGVIQQRAAMEQEIQRLQSALATAVQPEEAEASRRERRELLQRNESLEQRNRELQSLIDSLREDSTRLQQTVQGLKDELSQEKAALEREIRGEAGEARKTGGDAGPWFVNFGTYARRDMAERWADQLRPASGSAHVSPAQVQGRELYRVRITGLSNEETARRVARDLEQSHNLSKLWVGHE